MNHKENQDIIYRYMSYAEFLDILTNKRLTLKYPGLWPDNLEALFLKCFENKSEIEKLIKYYDKKYPPEYKGKNLSDFEIITSALIKTRCQCWSYKKDDLVLWNERNSLETVRIAVNKSVFNDKYIFNDDKKNYPIAKLTHYVVTYKPSITCKVLVNQFIKNDRNPFSIFTVKKNSFRYEKEHRLLLIPGNANSSSFPNEGDPSNRLLHYFCNLKNEFGLKEKYVQFDSKNIIGVLVNPRATDSFVQLVEHDCKRFNIKFSGVSDLLS